MRSLSEAFTCTVPLTPNSELALWADSLGSLIEKFIDHRTAGSKYTPWAASTESIRSGVRKWRRLLGIMTWLGVTLPSAAMAQLDTLDQAFGDFSIRSSSNPIFGQSFEAFYEHIGGVTLLAAGAPGSFYLLVTGARPDALAPGGNAPDFGDVRYGSSLIELPSMLDFEELPLAVDAYMEIGETVFLVADMFSEGASGRVSFRASNALTSDAMPSGDLMWITEENVPDGATALTDLHVDGVFTPLFADLAVRVTVPEPAKPRMQMLALLVMAALVLLRESPTRTLLRRGPSGK